MTNLDILPLYDDTQVHRRSHKGIESVFCSPSECNLITHAFVPQLANDFKSLFSDGVWQAGCLYFKEGMLTECEFDEAQSTLNALCLGSGDSADPSSQHKLSLQVDLDKRLVIASTCTCRAPVATPVKLCRHVVAGIVSVCSHDFCPASDEPDVSPSPVSVSDYRAPDTLRTLKGAPLPLEEVQVCELIPGKWVFIAGHSVSSDPLWFGKVNAFASNFVEIDCLPKPKSPAAHAWKGQGASISVPLERVVRVLSDPFLQDTRTLKPGLWSDLCKLVRSSWRWGQPPSKKACMSQKSPKRSRQDDSEEERTPTVCTAGEIYASIWPLTAR